MRRLIVLALAFMPLEALAKVDTYAFTVSCPHIVSVEIWHIGKFDPGREYLRVVTGTHNPGCTISTASEHDLRSYPIVEHKRFSAYIKGVPFLGGILRNLFWD